MVPLMRLMHGVIRLLRPAMLRRLTTWLAERPRPAAVVSVMPHFNGIMADALRAAHPGVPLVVVLTDFADFPPRFWIEPGTGRVVVGSDEARAQALALGIAPDRVSRVSGMILRPDFYRASGPEARARMRAELGLADDDFAVMLLFGGKGSPEMPRLSDALLAAEPKAHVIAVCGDNPALVARMTEIEARTGGRLHDARLHRSHRGAARGERPAGHEARPRLARRGLPRPRPGRRHAQPAHDPAGALQHRLREGPRSRPRRAPLERDPGRRGAPACRSRRAGGDPRADRRAARQSRGL